MVVGLDIKVEDNLLYLKKIMVGTDFIGKI